MALPNNPQTRKEMYLSNMAGQGTALPSEPHTREEEYLDYIAKNGGGGGGTGDGDMKKSVYDGDLAVAGAGGIKSYVTGTIADKTDLTNLANEFSTSYNYVIGQYVTYNGKMYRFISNHSAGEWSTIEVEEVKVSGELSYKENEMSFNSTDFNIIQDTHIDPDYKSKYVNLNKDTTPEYNSSHPITSGGVYTALAGKVDKVSGKGLSTNDYDDTEKAKVAGAFPRSEQAVLGAKNLANLEYREMTNDSTFTESNGVYTIANNNGTSQYPSMKIYKTSALDAFPAGKYTLSVNIVSFTNNTAVLAFRNASDNAILSSKALSVGKMSITYESAVPFTIGFLLRLGSTADAEIQFSEFMIALDNDLTYVPFAMTNRDLTDFAKHTKTVLLGTASSYTFSLPNAANNNNIHALFIALMSSTGNADVNVLAGYRIGDTAGNIKTIAGAATGSFDTTTGKFTINADGPYRTLTIIANAEILS